MHFPSYHISRTVTSCDMWNVGGVRYVSLRPLAKRSIWPICEVPQYRAFRLDYELLDTLCWERNKKRVSDRCANMCWPQDNLQSKPSSQYRSGILGLKIPWVLTGCYEKISPPRCDNTNVIRPPIKPLLLLNHSSSVSRHTDRSTLSSTLPDYLTTLSRIPINQFFFQ